MSTPKNVVTATTIQNLIEELKTTFVRSIQLTTTSDKVDTLIGNDTNKSIRTIAAEELAAQLIPANADQALDTLQEISNWIQTHPEDAAAMYTAITNLQNKVTLGTNGTAEYSTVKEYVEAAINALNLGNYATAAQLTSLANRVSAVENRPVSTETTYTLPTASTSTKGGVKIGTGLTMDGETLKTSLSNASTTTAGLMSKEDKIKLDSLTNNSTNYTLPTASNTVKGGVKITGVDGLVMDGITLKPALGVGLSLSSAHNIYLKRASDSEKGGVIITGNDGLIMDGETLKTSLSTASATKKGSVKVSGTDGLIMDKDTLKIAYGVGLGISSLNNLYLKRASDSEKGGVIITGTDGLVMDGETLKTSLSNASTTKAGLMSKDDKIKLSNLASITTEGENITIIGGTIKAADTKYTLPTASTSTKGGIKVGTGLAMNGDTLNCTVVASTTYTLPTASTSTKGGVKIGTGLTMDGETLKSTFTGYSNSDTIRISGSAVTSSSDTVTANNGGSILALGGSATGSDTSTATGGNGGIINMNGGDAEGNSSSKAGHGGWIHLNGGDGQIPGTGGIINLHGGISKTSSIKNGTGGTINLYGGADTNSSLGGDGGTIDMRGGAGNSSSGRGGNGGVIDLTGGIGATMGSSGSIKGNVFFTDTPTFLKGANGLSNTVSSSDVYIPTADFDSIMAYFTT